IIPDETTQEVVTNVIVKDGMTIVIGGLFKEEIKSNRSQVPFLGDIPIIGTAFRGHDDDNKREEIIFLITPSIVNDNVLLSQGEDARNTIDRVRAGYRQGLLPWSRDRMTAQLNVEAERYYREGDMRKALWTLSRSLSLNPRQTDALRLRERLTGQRELWPTQATFDGLLSSEMNDRIRAIPAATQPPAYNPQPYGSTNFPTDPLKPDSVVPVPSADPWKNKHPGAMPPAAPAAPTGDGKPMSNAPQGGENADTASVTTNTFFGGGNPAGDQGATPGQASGQMVEGVPAGAGSNGAAPSEPTDQNQGVGEADRFMNEIMGGFGFDQQQPPAAAAPATGFASGKAVGGMDEAPVATSTATPTATAQQQRFFVLPFVHGFWFVPVPAQQPFATAPTDAPAHEK
ncbi:MAG: hypothetical protein KIT68_07985, partial [Phycisphaeraceae bacterium]|nr:hypothetical protein [Phycisphaeraceae bacterium]